MILLAIETSTRLLSVALWRDGQVIDRSKDHPNGGSDLILPWVGELLAEAGIGLGQIDGFAFGAGPGGFTGLRLACGIAQGLAYGTDRPVVGIGSLEALAEASGRAAVYACLDARMDEVYCAAYRRDGGSRDDGGLQEVLAPVVCPPTEAPLLAGREWAGVGDGFGAYASALATRLDTVAVIDAQARPMAVAVAALAAPRLQRGEGQPAAQAAPRYVRDKVALTTAERLARGGVR